MLQDVQENDGYISEEAMRAMSQGLGVPLIEVYRAASFYKAFRLKPSGKNVLTICMGTACHVRGSRLLLDQAIGQLGVKPGEVTPDGKFSLVQVECLGSCGTAPMFQLNDDYHEDLTIEKVDELLDGLP